MAAVATPAHLAAAPATVDSASPTSPTFAFHAPPRTANGVDAGTARLPALNGQATSYPGPQPPHGVPFRDFLRTWTDSQVGTWLTDLRLGHLADLFAENDITGDVILDLDQAELKEMGVRKVGERVKVIGGIKTLKQRCRGEQQAQKDAVRSRMASQGSLLATPPTTGSSGSASRQGTSPHISTRPLVQEQEILVHSPQTIVTTPASTLRPRAGSLRQHSRAVPPPLRLAERSDPLPRAYQIGFTNSSRPTAVASTSDASASRTQLGARTILSPRGHLEHGAPSQPPPQTSLPAPPAAGGSSSRRSRMATDPGSSAPGAASSSNARDRAPTISHGASSSITNNLSLWATGDYGLPRNPAPGASTSSPARKVSGGGPGSGLTTSSSSGSLSHSTKWHEAHHRKTPSLNVTSASGPSLPSHAHGKAPAHPYASSTSPTADSFNLGPVYTGLGAAAASSPPTGGSNLLRREPPLPQLTSTLTPISEDRSGLTGSGSETRDVGFKVGRGGFSKPSTAGGTVGVSAGTGQVTPHSIDEVKRKTIKVSTDDGESRVINVENAQSAAEVLERVLRKWGKTGPGADEWGLYVTSGGADGNTLRSKPLDDSEVLAICRSATRPERQRGLTLRKARTGKRSVKKLQDFFGETVPDVAAQGGALSPTTPTYPAHLQVSVPGTSIEPASPTHTYNSQGDDVPPTPRDNRLQTLGSKDAQKRKNRASVISVMSGLSSIGGDPIRRDLAETDDVAPLRPPSGLLASGRGKLRNFFGHRPPSELISDHLVDYFPQVEKKKLSKTVRQSMRRSMALNRRASHYSTSGGRDSAQGLANNLEPSSRFSVSSVGSITPPTHHPNDSDLSLEAPPLTQSASARRSFESSRSFTPSILEPEEDTESDAFLRPGLIRTDTSSTRRSAGGLSTLTAPSRKSRDSDNASLLTVDEITAEVENRRLSFNPDGDDDDARSTRKSVRSMAMRSRPGSILEEGNGSDEQVEDEVEEEEDEDEDEEDEDEEDEDEDEEAEEENDDPQKMTTAGHKTSFKWVRGALIGSGSFGSVYLGMHALNGTLMAVKQVERPTGSSTNEERKKNMLSAIEREIEFLKDLQHPNIVQYLDSAGDDKFVNIFLEYVPGGSVSGLLKNLGAFEEALVRTFTRQILDGLNYLHERDIIHRDIKGANILVDNKGVIKISDFGISKRVEDDLVPATTKGPRVHRLSLQGSVFWMAPEVVKQKSHTRKADIWSLGCLIVEMLTGEHPWPTLTQMQAIFRIGSGSSRPEIPDDVSKDCTDMLDKTFAIDHVARPSAKALLNHAFIVDSSQTPTRASFDRLGA